MRKISRLLSFLSALILVSNFSFGLIIFNESPIAFPIPDGYSPDSIENDVVQGAGYFLKSYSDFLLFLNKIELSVLEQTNYPELKGLISSAVKNLWEAKNSYTSLISIASATPYDQYIQGKLKTFNYLEFQVQGHFNQEIFKYVEGYLKAGDVTGAYIRFKSGIELILEILYRINQKIEENVLPDTVDIWKVNQAYSEGLLFGQYVAQVFSKIK